MNIQKEVLFIKNSIIFSSFKDTAKPELERVHLLEQLVQLTLELGLLLFLLHATNPIGTDLLVAGLALSP